MISSSHRFHGHNSLTYVHRNGVVVRSRGLSLKYVSNSRRDTYRAAVIVSKKVHKSAVVRNRIRRRIYELIRLHVDEKKPIDLVLQVFDENLASLSSNELLRSVVELFAKAKLLRTNQEKTNRDTLLER